MSSLGQHNLQAVSYQKPARVPPVQKHQCFCSLLHAALGGTVLRRS